jgi:protein O-mannosyl-transferase
MPRAARARSSTAANHGTTHGFRWDTIAYCAGLAAILGAIFAPGISAPFIYDDGPNLVENSSIAHLWPLVGDAEHHGPLNPPAELSTSGRPLVNFSFAVNYYFGGLEPSGYHAFNLALHWISAVLVMLIVRNVLELEYFQGRLVGAASPLAFLTALLWAIHPLQTETVVYTTQRTELMVGLFYFAVLYAALRYWSLTVGTKRKLWLALAVASCLAGAACKEIMVTAPVLILLFERTFIAGSIRNAWRRSWPLYSGLFASWVLLLCLNYNGPRSDTAGFHTGLAAYIWWYTQSKFLWTYFKLVVWPWPLSIHYAMPYLNSFAEAWPWLFMTGILIAVITVLLLRRRAAGYVGTWVLIILSPTLIVPIATETGADRRMYLPLAAIATLFVCGGYGLVQRIRNRSAAVTPDFEKFDARSFAPVATIAIVLAILWCFLDIRRLAAYQDACTLWKETAAIQPDDSLTFNNWGSTLLDANRSQEAIEVLKHALQLNPKSALAHDNLGVALNDLGRYSEALQEHRVALQIDPNSANFHSNLGLTLTNMGRPEEAIKELELALKLKPEDALAYYNLGQIYAGRGEYHEAKTYLEQAIVLNPKRLEALNSLALVLGKLGQTEQAIAQFHRIIAQNPQYIDAYNNLGNLLNQSRRPNEAIQQYEAVLRLQPKYPLPYFNLALTYAKLNERANAIDSAEHGIESAKAIGDEKLAQQISEWLEKYRAKNGGFLAPPPPPSNPAQ